MSEPKNGWFFWFAAIFAGYNLLIGTLLLIVGVASDSADVADAFDNLAVGTLWFLIAANEYEIAGLRRDLKAERQVRRQLTDLIGITKRERP